MQLGLGGFLPGFLLPVFRWVYPQNPLGFLGNLGIQTMLPSGIQWWTIKDEARLLVGGSVFGAPSCVLTLLVANRRICGQ